MNDIESAVQRIYTNESDHKAQIEQLLGLLNPLFPVDASAAFDVAPIVKLVGAVVRVEQGSMLVSRNLVQSIVARLEPPMPRDVMKKLGNQLIEVTQARSISYEEQTSALRLKLSSIADAEGSFLEAAEHLLAIPLETGQRPYSADFKMSTYLRVAELCLEGGDIDKAETYVNRASMLQNETEDETLNIRHKSVYARVLDMRGRFIEAAQRYYELSGRVGLTISEKREALQRALTCTILASPSPSRTRLLNQLVKDERVHGLPAFGLLEKLYAEKLIKQEELVEFERGLLPHQRHLGGEKGETTGEADRTLLGKAVVEHNIQAAGKLYNNISFDTLAELLGVGVEKAEKTASKMISEKRLKAHIDQVDKYLHFEEHSPLEQWDGEIARLCAEASRVVQMITAAHPEFIAGLEQ